jgi:hypothetical protein
MRRHSLVPCSWCVRPPKQPTVAEAPPPHPGPRTTTPAPVPGPWQSRKSHRPAGLGAGACGMSPIPTTASHYRGQPKSRKLGPPLPWSGGGFGLTGNGPVTGCETTPPTLELMVPGASPRVGSRARAANERRDLSCVPTPRLRPRRSARSALRRGIVIASGLTPTLVTRPLLANALLHLLLDLALTFQPTFSRMTGWSATTKGRTPAHATEVSVRGPAIGPKPMVRRGSLPLGPVTSAAAIRETGPMPNGPSDSDGRHCTREPQLGSENPYGEIRP